MRTSIIVFVVLNVSLLLIMGFCSIPMAYQLAITAFLVGLVGIPHGAIDHVLFLQNSSIKQGYFYFFYFALIGVIVALWLFFPVLSLLFFLILSAYHFGQSQFSRYSNLSKLNKSLLYFSWGTSILCALMFYNKNETVQLFSETADLNVLLVIFQSSALKPILIGSSLLFLIVFFYNLNLFSRKKFTLELSLFILIHASFYFNTLLIGFSIYFATLHSLEVLKEEYDFLKVKIKNFKFVSFLSILIPYTLLSLAGVVILFGLSHFDILPLSKTLIVFISISALTLPHSVVMENFYKSVLKKS